MKTFALSKKSKETSTMKTTATTNNKTANYTKQASTNVKIKNEEIPANCVPFEVFANALKKAVKDHYERIA